MGLASFTTMLDQIADQGSAHPPDLIFGMTNDADPVDIKKLELFSGRIFNFNFAACFAGVESSYLKDGDVKQHIEPGHMHDGTDDIYLCVTSTMVEAVNYFIRN